MHFNQNLHNKERRRNSLDDGGVRRYRQRKKLKLARVVQVREAHWGYFR